MDLPNLFSSSKKKRATRKFLALDIAEEVITAGVWLIEDNRAKVVKTSSPIEWQDENINDLAEAADVAIEELGEDGADTNDVIFGLQDSWVTEKGIAEERKPLLKNLKEQLTLEPVGFVVTTEALVEYLQELEGGPISAVLLQFTSTNVTVAVVKAGKLGKKEVVGRSGDTVADVSEGLARFAEKTETIPARMIVFGSRMKTDELEQEKQTLLTFDWQKNFGFFHFPKIETLPQNILITSVCVSGGTEVAASLGLIRKTDVVIEQKEVRQVGDLETKQTETLQPTGNETMDVVEEVSVEPSMPQPAQEENFGFSEVNETGFQQASEQEVETQQEELSPTDNESFEFLRSSSNVSPPLPSTQPTFPQTPSIPSGAVRFNIFKKIQRIPGKIKRTIASLLAGATLREKFYSDLSGRKKKLTILIIMLFVLGISSVVGAMFLKTKTQAEVRIVLRTIPLSKELQIILDPEAKQTDPQTNTLKAEIVEREVTGSKEIPTTGKKVVGDHAKGKVTIYNRTGSIKTFPAATVLTASNNAKFTLDEEVSIASSSSGSDYSIQPGKAQASVTSVEIGSQYNVEANKEFVVANFDKLSYVASNDQAFNGGSSREIQAVSKEDRLKLENELTKELREQIKEQLAKVEEGESKFISTDSYEVTQKEFTAELNEEALNLGLTLTLTTTLLKYDTAQLTPIAQAQLQSSLPEGAVLREEKTAIHAKEVIQEKDKPIVLVATMTSEAIPRLDKDAIATVLSGKTLDQASSILRDKQEVASYGVIVKPNLAKIIFGRMPEKPSNISIQTRVE